MDGKENKSFLLEGSKIIGILKEWLFLQKKEGMDNNKAYSDNLDLYFSFLE